MKIAKIVSSTSHIAYIARVLDGRDGKTVPDPDDHGFGKFVTLPDGDVSTVGVICDSRLVNPEYQNFTPRTASMPALGELRRDVIDEKRSLIGILLLGTLAADDHGKQEIPSRLIQPGQTVHTMEQIDIMRFHLDGANTLQLNYLPNVLANAGALAVPLARAMIAALEQDCSQQDRRRLAVISNALNWRHTIGGLRI
ncbi:MAG TPA: hypothetical protein PKD26_15860 [Pyrinomonadaceae bacterium]|nr:hypothetical protein [Pyrinomonadaceae bacterium]